MSRPTHAAGLTALVGAVSLLGSVWTLGILRLGTRAVLVIFRRWQHLLAFAGSVLVVGWVVHATTPAGTPGTPVGCQKSVTCFDQAFQLLAHIR